MNMNNHDDRISSLLDGELSDAQLDELLSSYKGRAFQDLMETTQAYHQIGDVLRSEDLALQMSPDFSKKFSALLDAEPVILAPRSSVRKTESTPTSVRPEISRSRYFAISSVAAAVIVAFVMTPQILPLLHGPDQAGQLSAKADSSEPFVSANIKLASNTPASTNSNANDTEFASKLETQVEMLRDPRLDSYLMAHQKVSPSLENNSRYIQRANVVSEPDPVK